jgi:DNA polymerase-1
MKSTLLIDSGCIGARAVFTMGSLSYREMPTGVIYGYLKEIQRLFTEFQTNDILFFWDSKVSFRKKLFPEYKVKRNDNRTKKEKEMWKIAHEQYDILRTEILPNIGWTNQLLVEGLEADDLLHQAAMQLHEMNEKPLMVTSDQDMYQSLDYCGIWNPASKQYIDRAYLSLKHGVSPKEWAIVKSFAGCKSDEVPGILGVGEKTAASFIQSGLKRTSKKYQSITSELGKEVVKRNRPLVTLPFEGTPTLDFYENEFNFSKFEQICEELGMVSMLGHYSRTAWENILK